jgi:hypothetical protein
VKPVAYKWLFLLTVSEGSHTSNPNINKHALCWTLSIIWRCLMYMTSWESALVLTSGHWVSLYCQIVTSISVTF